MPRRHAGALVAVMVGITALAAGCTTPPPQTVASVDLGRYTGRWYQTAANPQPFEAGLVGITAEYGARPDGTISVRNQGFKDTCAGAVDSITGVARVVDRVSNAKLAVTFDTVPATRLFPGEYWIVDLDTAGYRWAVVTDSRRSSLFVLSRTPRLDPAIDAGIRQRLTANGFDLSRLTPTTPCE
jgi:apolipoprotein D and lipocalin family protein